MTKSGAHISDVLLLENLDKRILDSGKAMANISQNVNNYLNNVRDTLERQLEVIQNRLQEAEQKLSQAENALSVCHSSQVVDPLTGTVVPSCACEESTVESARTEVEMWRSKYEQGQRIFDECQREIGEYNGPGGGNSLILTMSDQQTPKASQFLRDCINKLQDVLSSNMSVNTDLATGLAQRESNSPSPDKDRTRDLKESFNL